MRKQNLSVPLLAFFLALSGSLPVRAQDGDKLPLRQAITLALQNSPDLKLAREQFRIALNEAAVGRSDFRPNLYSGSGAAYTSGYPAVPGGGLPALFDLSYNQALFNLPLQGQTKAAEDRAENAGLEADRARDDVIVRTASSYLDLANVRHALELLRSEQASVEKILAVTRDRVAANQELPIEATRGELALARTQERIIKIEDREETLSEQMHNLTGIPEDRPIEVDTEEPDFVSNQQENELLGLALQSDRGLQEAGNERTAREHLLKGAKGEYWPTLSIVGDYQVLARFNNYKLYFNPNAPFQRNEIVAGIQVTIPVFSAKTRADIALAKSQLNAAELTLGARRQNVRVELLQKVRNVRELDATREVARLDLKLAQETLEVVQAKFDEGRATLQEIEQARLDDNDKWIGFLDADFARQQGQLTLLQATGQLAKVFQ